MCFAAAVFNSKILVAEDWEERDSDSGGLRKDFRVIFKAGAEPGLETEGSGFRIGFGMRGRVYCGIVESHG